MHKPYIILQARMNSERLPGKVMHKIGGKPLIGILINRLKKSGVPIVLATSTNPENDILVDFVKSLGVEVFRGSEDNVLERYYYAANSVGATIVVRITGDNPLIDGAFVKELVKKYIQINNPRAYLSPGKSKTFPLGMSFEIFSNTLLEEAFFNSTYKGEFEHVTPYMHQNVPKNIEIVTITNNEDKSKYRVTVDTLEDFNLIKKLIEVHNCENKSLQEIVDVLDNSSELHKLNEEVRQKRWDE